MDKIEKGKFVEMAYELYEVGEDGKEELMLEMTKEKPERFVYGDEDNMLPAICQAIGGKTAGEGFDFTVTPENGFGEYQDGLVKKLSRKMFEMDGEFDSKHVYVGAAITMMTAEGRPAPGMVLDITDEDVTVDFNHPMAGMTMHFKERLSPSATPPRQNSTHSAAVAQATAARRLLRLLWRLPLILPAFFNV